MAANDEVIIDIKANIIQAESGIKKLEKSIKDATKTSTITVSSGSSMEEEKKKLLSLQKELERLHKLQQTLQLSTVSHSQRMATERINIKKMEAQRLLEVEKQHTIQVNLLADKQLESLKARHGKANSILRHSHSIELMAEKQKYKELGIIQAASRKQMASAEREYAKTAMGALTAGTTFGHKLVTTAMYATAGSGLFALASGFIAVKDSIVEADKYLHMFMGVLEMSGTQAKALQTSIFSVGKEIGGTVQGMSEAALMLGRAGIANEKLAGGLKVSAMAANIAGDSIENITEMLAAWATVYPGEDLDHLGDVMAKVANESLLSIDGLKTATSYITASGAAAGITSDALIAMAGAWKMTGKADSIVGTEMRRFFMMIEGGSEDARKAYWALGIDLDKVNKGLKGTVAESKAAMLDMFYSIKSATPEQLKALESVKSGMNVLEKQTVNSSLIAAQEYGKMVHAADTASGSLKTASDKIALSYEKMWERLVFAGKEGATKFEASFSKSAGVASTTADGFDKVISGVTRTIGVLSASIGGLAGTLFSVLKPAIDVITLSMEGWVKVLEWINHFMDKSKGDAAVVGYSNKLKEQAALVKDMAMSVELDKWTTAYNNLAKAELQASGVTKDHIKLQKERALLIKNELYKAMIPTSSPKALIPSTVTAVGPYTPKDDKDSDKALRKAQRLAQDALDLELSRIKTKFAEEERSIYGITEVQKKELDVRQKFEEQQATIRARGVDDYKKKVEDTNTRLAESVTTLGAEGYKLDQLNDSLSDKAQLEKLDLAIKGEQSQELKAQAEYEKRIFESALETKKTIQARGDIETAIKAQLTKEAEAQLELEEKLRTIYENKRLEGEKLLNSIDDQLQKTEFITEQEQTRLDILKYTRDKTLEIQKLNAKNQLLDTDREEAYKRLAKLEAERLVTNSTYYKVAMTGIEKLTEGFDNFFDVQSEGWMDFGDLTKGILNDMYKMLLKLTVLDPAKSWTKDLASSTLKLLGGAGGVGTQLSADALNSVKAMSFTDSEGIMTTEGGTVVDAAGKILEGGGDLDKLLDGVSILSNIKTAYTLATTGVATSIFSGFSSAAAYADQIATFMGASAETAGMISSGISEFGYGVSSIFSGGAFEGLSAAGAGQLLGGAVLGYAAGSIGDKLLGAETQAGIGGAAGAAIGTAILPGVGTAIGAVLGSAIGGIFGSTKTTDTGIAFGQTTGSDQGFDSIQSYVDKRKKSWFSSSSWTEFAGIDTTTKKKIEGVFDTYDYLLTQLGSLDKITISAGKYSRDTFQDQLAKNFLSTFTGIPAKIEESFVTYTQDFAMKGGWVQSKLIDESVGKLIESLGGTVTSVITTRLLDNKAFTDLYNQWVEYAKEIDKTIMEALSESVNSFIASTRDFETWLLEKQGKPLEALAKQAQWATEDFQNLSNMLGATGITVENFTEMYRDAVKNSFDPTTISQWKALGESLMAAGDAQAAYAQAIGESTKAIIDAQLALQQASRENIGSFMASLMIPLELATDLASKLGVNVATSVEELVSTFNKLAYDADGLTDAELDLLNINKELLVNTGAYQEKIDGLNTTIEETVNSLSTLTKVFDSITDMVDTLRGATKSADTTMGEFYSGLELAKQAFAAKDYESYSKAIESVVKASGSFLDPSNFRTGEEMQFAQYLAANKAEELGKLTLTEIDYLEQIEKNTRDQISVLVAAMEALGASINKALLDQIGVDPSITTAYQNILGRAPETAGAEYWTTQLNTGSVSNIDMDDAIANAAIPEIYRTLLGRAPDAAGAAYWSAQLASGAIAPSDIDDAILAAAIANGELPGHYNGGYTGDMSTSAIAGIVHGKEYVVNARTTRDLGLNNSAGVFQEILKEFRELKQLNITVAASAVKSLSTQRAMLGEMTA